MIITRSYLFYGGKNHLTTIACFKRFLGLFMLLMQPPAALNAAITLYKVTRNGLKFKGTFYKKYGYSCYLFDFCQNMAHSPDVG